MSALDYSRGLAPDVSFNQVLMHPTGWSILRRWDALPRDEEERYALASISLELAVRTTPAMIGDAAKQDALLAELAAVPPFLPASVRRAEEAGIARKSVATLNQRRNWTRNVPMYGRFELVIEGPSDGAPYREFRFAATIDGPGGTWRVPGFHDHDGIYRLRFLPLQEGAYSFRTESDVASLNGHAGQFEAMPAALGRHGPVTVDGFHFRHHDGEPYRPVGTTAYAWLHQDLDRRDRTMSSLGNSGFNKLRMCLFPKWFAFNEIEPVLAPFIRRDDGTFDFDRPEPKFWQELERRLDQLADLNIEADIVFFHPYDRWGFQNMGAAADDRYVRYAVSRLAAFANVWWSLANEHDVMASKTIEDWERIASVVRESDPTEHLRSIHHCLEPYDHQREWITHASLQSTEVERVGEWRARWGKPVVVDECSYEGDLRYEWGDITAAELVRRHWVAAVRGGYAGHGETYAHPDQEIWWATGGDLRGQSPDRIAFLRSVMESGPMWEPQGGSWSYPTGGAEGELYVCYLGPTQAMQHLFILDPSRTYTVEVIDTWEMTIETVARGARGRINVPLPGRPQLAVRFRADDVL